MTPFQGEEVSLDEAREFLPGRAARLPRNQDPIGRAR